MAVQCVLVGKGKDDVFTAVYGETTFDKVLKAYNEKKVVQVIYQNRIYYLDNTTIVDSPEAFSFISVFSNQNDETGEIKHYVISLMTGDNWSGPFLQKSTPATHANTHSKNGDDPLAPADIGAMELSEDILKQSNEDITSQVARALSKNLVPFSGGTMTGLLNVLTPVGDSNATTKKYVDDALSEKIGMDGIGDLHVWRKTVVTNQEIPAGYTLGISSAKTLAKSSENSGNSYATFYISSNISVDNAGNVTMDSPATVDIWQGIDGYDSDERAIFGKFIKFHSVSNSNAGITSDLETGIYFIPNSAKFTRYRDGNRSGYTNISACQKVNAYPLTPAGTTTTYPVSTNPNAYQEGNDAKPAGYVAGNVESGQFSLGITVNLSATNRYNYSNTITVNNDGVVSLLDSSPIEFNGGSSAYNNEAMAKIIGKYISLERVGDSNYPPDFDVGAVWFIPADATYGNKGSYPNNINYITKRQSITGYAAIPAGTTIEYLGKLGDKARVQVVSYVGTGTYGKDNKNQLTFSGKPRFIMVPGDAFGYAYIPKGPFYYIMAGNYATLENLNCVWNDDTNTMTWYHSNYPYRQYNVSGGKYTFVAIY